MGPAVEHVVIKSRPRRVYRGVLLVLLPVFLLHASQYLYYFADDEAIPLVYAKRLLAGEGLSYNSLEGRVEGYSDFLHVLTSALALTFVRTAGWSQLSVFFVLKALSLAWALLALWCLARSLSAHRQVTTVGLVVGVGFLALAPPLALWSCSSLEMALVGLLVTVCCAALIVEPIRLRTAAVASSLLLLTRIDGAIYVLALVGPWIVFGPRRREVWWRVGVPVLCVAAAYHGARVWYFGELLTAPIYTKVLHTLVLARNAVVKAPEVPYGLAFLRMYGLPPAAAGIATLVVVCRRHPTALLLLCGAAVLMAYAAVVGDWMFGFRFFIPALPPIAGALAFAVSAIRRPMIARATVAGLLAWFGWAAVGQALVYEKRPHRESWLRSPSVDPSRYFGPYYRLWMDLRPHVQPGDTLAYNQAGFVPFMLDVDNIDDLGICSKFVAKLPTTDVVFTGVGRYSPLTNAHALRAAHAYLLYHRPKYVVAPLGDLKRANGNRIPSRILRSQYRLLFVSHGTDAVYERGASSPEPIGPGSFLENLAHPSSLHRAFVNDREIPSDRFFQRLSMLADGTERFGFARRLRIRLVISTDGLPMSEIDFGRVRSTTDATLRVGVLSNRGETLFAADAAVQRGRARAVNLTLPAPLQAAEVRIDLEQAGGDRASVWMTDLRLQGQTRELVEYVRQLRFDGDVR